MPQQYRKKPVTITAEQLLEDGSNAQTLAAWIGPDARVRAALAKPTDPDSLKTYIDVRTLEGTMTANPGDWIIRGVQGEFYPCKPDVFAATYDRVEPIDTNSDGHAALNEHTATATGLPRADA